MDLRFLRYSLLILTLSLSATALAGPPKVTGTIPDRPRVNHYNFKKNKDFRVALHPRVIDYKLLRDAIFYATNQERVRWGLPPLKHNRLLELAAHLHAQRMATLKFFSHENAQEVDLRTPFDRARQVGIANPNVAENIATEFIIRYEAGMPVYAVDAEEGYFSRYPKGRPIPPHSYISFAETLLKQWMSSPAHRENILHVDALEVGIGVAIDTTNGIPRIKAVQLFQWFDPVEEADVTRGVRSKRKPLQK